ncbi:hypothetical protein ACJJI3_11225 [Microbulbifer sp. ZKSA004]|uniref:hypothetical protein n=1 Tax=Microbulbifer sp. ZKSA004 TaxID=3243389 RepID=UPI00403A2C63
MPFCGPQRLWQDNAATRIAGFQPVAAGNIQLSGEVISSRGKQIPTEKWKIGMVFQDYALFSHLTVEQNIAFGIQSLPKASKIRDV